jgi:hypothetical protein
MQLHTLEKSHELFSKVASLKDGVRKNVNFV